MSSSTSTSSLYSSPSSSSSCSDSNATSGSSSLSSSPSRSQSNSSSPSTSQSSSSSPSRSQSNSSDSLSSPPPVIPSRKRSLISKKKIKHAVATAIGTAAPTIARAGAGMALRMAGVPPPMAEWIEDQASRLFTSMTDSNNPDQLGTKVNGDNRANTPISPRVSNEMKAHG